VRACVFVFLGGGGEGEEPSTALSGPRCAGRCSGGPVALADASPPQHTLCAGEPGVPQPLAHQSRDTPRQISSRCAHHGRRPCGSSHCHARAESSVGKAWRRRQAARPHPSHDHPRMKLTAVQLSALVGGCAAVSARHAQDPPGGADCQPATPVSRDLLVSLRLSSTRPQESSTTRCGQCTGRAATPQQSH
jgi:hypothetical protein